MIVYGVNIISFRSEEVGEFGVLDYFELYSWVEVIRSYMRIYFKRKERKKRKEGRKRGKDERREEGRVKK